MIITIQKEQTIGRYSSNSNKVMRRRNLEYCRDNKYDQTTNFAIELETEVNRSVVFPKITAKMVDQELRDYVNRKKLQEDHTITQLKGQVDQLKRNLYMLEDQKYLNSRMRTQDIYQNSSFCRDGSFCKENLLLCNNSHCLERSRCHRDKQLRSHHVDESYQNLRNSEDSSNSRMYRNTDKQTGHLYGEKKSEVELESMVMQQMSKGKQNGNSQQKIIRNSKVSINSGSASKHLLSKTEKVLKQLAKKKKQKSNPQARRRLRACIMAVYFAIFIRSFGRKIYQNKLKAFMLEYPHEIGKYYDHKGVVTKFKTDQSKIWQIIEERMNIMQEVQRANLSSCLKDAADVKKVKVHFQFLINQELNSSQKDEKEPLTYQEQILFPKNVEFIMGNLINIVDKFTDSFSHLIESTDFVDKYWKTISQGLLNDSFINNSRPKLLARVLESSIVRPQANKQKIIVEDEQTEITLLTFDIFCRIFCFKWMSKLHRDKIHKRYTTQSAFVGNFLLSILYIIGETMVDQKIKTCIKASTIVATILKMKVNSNRKIRPILPLSIKKNNKHIDPNCKKLISDPPLFEQASTVVLSNEEDVQKIKTRLLNSGTELYQKIREKMVTNAKEMKNSTFEEKYIIHGDKEREENLLHYSDPTPPQSQIPSFKFSEQSFESRKQHPVEKKPKMKLAVNVPKRRNS